MYCLTQLEAVGDESIGLKVWRGFLNNVDGLRRREKRKCDTGLRLRNNKHDIMTKLGWFVFHKKRLNSLGPALNPRLSVRNLQSTA